MVDEDTQLMLRVCEQGDANAFARLYTKHMPHVMAYLRQTINYVGAAEDIAQEAFTRLWARRCEYRGQAKFSTYLYSYVRLVCLEEKRARFRQRMLAGGVSQDLLETAVTVESAATMVGRRETNALLEQAVSHLPAKQRTALTLFYTAGMSVPQAATALGCSSKCFESRLTRGRLKLRLLLRAQSAASCTSVSVDRKHILFQEKVKMIDKTEFGDIAGGMVAGCHCAGKRPSCSCYCSWWFCAAGNNCNASLIEDLRIFSMG